MNKPTVLKTAIAIAALGLAVLLGWSLAARAPVSESSTHAHGAEDAPATLWTCSMHPQVRQPEPGDCPICGMSLIPLQLDDESTESSDLPRLRLSERSMALMSVQTAPVQRREAYAELRLPGRIAVDETRREIISARFAGRVDRLFVDFTGTEVRRGEHLAELYSPQLYGAQEEYLQAIHAQTRRNDAEGERMVDAAATKLRLLGLNARQIQAIREKGEATTHLTYFSPATGTILERMVTSGDYLETGSPMYMVADLSEVWVDLEAFESELQWLRYGQPVTIHSTAFPGDDFTGRIANIDPEVDPVQRTVRVRVNLENAQRKLKPGMLVNGTIRARVAANGDVFEASLAGKWVCPMHPEVIQDVPATCDICGMDLVPSETLGYFAASDGEARDPLVIPASAPLLTGKRAVVYVRSPGADAPVFEARTVELGHRLGDLYPVLSGLDAGELVVTNGQFKIDSELQIRGRPSMMSASHTPVNPAHSRSDPGMDAEDSPTDPREAPESVLPASSVDEDLSEALVPVLDAYLSIVDALADDSLEQAKAAARSLETSLRSIGEHRLSGDAHLVWMNHYGALREAVQAMETASDIDEFRAQLQSLTTAMESTYVTFGGGQLPPVRRAHCPMVEGGTEINGESIGTWLQTGDTITNPYWGTEMLGCGDFHGRLGMSEDAE